MTPTQLTRYYIFPNSIVFFKNFGIVKEGVFQFDNLYRQTKNSLQCLDYNTGRVGLIYYPPMLYCYYYRNILHIASKKQGYLNHFKAILRFFQNQLNLLIVAVTYGHYNIIQFVGFRFRQRWFRGGQVLRYRLGYNKKVWFKCPNDFVMAIRKISPKKRTHFFFSHDRFLLRQMIFLIHAARPSTLYKGRGVNIKEQPMVLKEGKKALW